MVKGHWSNDFQGLMVIGQESVVKGQRSRAMIRSHCQRSGSLSEVKDHGTESMVTSQMSWFKGQESEP